MTSSEDIAGQSLRNQGINWCNKEVCIPKDIFLFRFCFAKFDRTFKFIDFLQGKVFFMAPWSSGYRYCKTLLNKVWTQVLFRFISYSHCVGSLRWWETPTTLSAGKKTSKPYHKNNSSSSSIQFLFFLLK